MNPPSPDSIVQGALANCYFLSAISTIAENPERIKVIFVNPNLNSAGIYGVKFCINGQFKQVVVDDFLPVYKSSGKLAFSSTKDGSIWLSLLEKAWAKVHGNYERTILGNVEDAYSIITGAPVHVIDYEIEQKEENFEEAEFKELRQAFA